MHLLKHLQPLNLKVLRELENEYNSLNLPTEVLEKLRNAIGDFRNHVDDDDEVSILPIYDDEAADFLYDTMKIFAGELWGIIYETEFYIKYKKATPQAIKKELDYLNQVEKYVHVWKEDDVILAKGIFPKALEIITEYKRIKTSYYSTNKIEKLDANAVVTWVYGRFFHYRQFLRLQKLKQEEIRPLIHAFWCYYMQKANLLEFHSMAQRNDFCNEKGIMLGTFNNHWNSILNGSQFSKSLPTNSRALDKVIILLHNHRKARIFAQEDLQRINNK